MEIPLTLWELRLWLAANAILLLMASELLYTRYGRAFMLNKKRLRIAAVILGVVFVITVLIEAYEVWQGLQRL